MHVYLDLIRDILDHGILSQDRTGTGTRSVFGRQLRFDLSIGFPAVTTKKLYFRGVVGELLWFLSGSTNIKPLVDQDIHIWDEWATETGDLGPVYGQMWRAWPVPSQPGSSDVNTQHHTLDQISWLLEEIRTNPWSRRLVVSAWNPALLPRIDQTPRDNAACGLQALPPCHTLFQFYVREGRLSCQLYQRSCDVFLGLPFNIASYALLTHMIAAHTNLSVGEFIWTGGDIHLYTTHTEQARRQLTRTPRTLPKVTFQKRPTLFEYQTDDFTLTGYDPHPAIKADISV